MSAICESDVKAALGDIDALVLSELVRTHATAHELARAIELARDPACVDVKNYRNLPSRLQRLTDLLSVTGLGDYPSRTRAA